MKEYTKFRLGCFSGDIENFLKEIMKELILLNKVILEINSLSIIDDCREFFYQLLDQIVLPYCVFGFEQNKRKNTNISFSQFFENYEWIKQYPSVYEHAIIHLKFSVSNLKKALCRLKKDWPKLFAQLDVVPTDIIRLDSLLVTSSDRHNFGQQALLFSFRVNNSKQLRLLYKPSNIAHLDILSEILPDLSPPKVYLVTDLYGWQEYIAYGDPDNISDYYISAGRLLATYAMINGTDAHFQNVIACPCGPVIVDWETVFTNTSYFKRQNVDTDLITFTGLIQVPKEWWQFWMKSRVLNAGLQANGVYRDEMLGIYAISDGTEDVSVGYGRKTPYKFINIPQSVSDNAKDCLIKGFSSGLETVRAIDDFNVQYIVDSCFGLTFRQLIRHTAFYKWLMLKALNPEILEDFQNRTRTDFFRRSLKSILGRCDFVEYEISCLIRGDVPIFHQCPNSKHLYDGDGNVYRDFFSKTAHTEFDEKIYRIKQPRFLRKNIRILERIKF